jgi:Tfp pilus assembly protein PilN
MKRINLLPPEHRVRASRERGLMYIIVLLVAIVAVLGVVYFQQHSKVAEKQTELNGLTADTAAVTAQAAALQPFADIETSRAALTQTAKNITDSRVYWSTIFEEVSLVIPENVRLDTLNCAVPPTMLPGGAADTTAASNGADVTFTGITYDPDDVAVFMTRLGLIPQLTNVQLTTSARTAQTSTSSANAETGSTATPSAAPVVYRWNFTVTAQVRSYLTAPPTTTLQEAAQ